MADDDKRRVLSANLGYPPVGRREGVSQLIEGYREGRLDEEAFDERWSELRRERWEFQRERGVDVVPTNDLTVGDPVLETAVMVGAVPRRFEWETGDVELETRLAMAGVTRDEGGPRPLSKRQWFETNAEYVVPEFDVDRGFELASRSVIEAYEDARDAGFETRPVLLGPVSFLLSGATEGQESTLEMLDELLPVYRKVLEELADAGARRVQVDEPYLTTQLSEQAARAYREAYESLEDVDIDVMLTTYFGGLGDNLALALGLPVDGVHLDLVEGGELDQALAHLDDGDKRLSLGVVDGRRVWRTDIEKTLKRLRKATDTLGLERVLVAPSCSLAHVPVEAPEDVAISPKERRCLAFADEKLVELSVLARGATLGKESVGDALAASRSALRHRDACDAELIERLSVSAPRSGRSSGR